MPFLGAEQEWLLKSQIRVTAYHGLHWIGKVLWRKLCFSFFAELKVSITGSRKAK